MYLLSLQPPEVTSKPAGAPVPGPKAPAPSQLGEHDRAAHRWVLCSLVDGEQAPAGEGRAGRGFAGLHLKSAMSPLKRWS